MPIVGHRLSLIALQVAHNRSRRILGLAVFSPYADINYSYSIRSKREG